MRRNLQGALKWVAHVIVAIDVALLLAAAAQFGRMPIVNNAIDIWFDLADPTLQTLKEEQRLFGSDTWMLATVWMRAGRVDEAADVARGLTRDLERIGTVTRVLSPASLEVLQQNEQGLFFDRIDPDAGWTELRNALLAHPIARNFLVYDKSPGMFSLLIKEQSALSTVGADRQRLVAEVRRVLDSYPAVEASAVSGVAVINAGLNGLSWGDFKVLVPATFGLASLVLLVVIRFRVRTTLALMLPVCVAALALVAAMLLAGRPLTMITIALPGLIFTLGIACSLHVTGWISNWLRDGRGSPGQAAEATIRQLLRPMLVSQITTAFGFGALAVVQVRPVQEMALFGAAGVVYSALHVLFVLPKCLYWFGAMDELTGTRPMFAGSRWSGSRLEALVDWLRRVQRLRYWILASTAAVCAGIVWLISLVQYDSTYLNMIDARERLRRDYARFASAGLPSSELSILIRRTGDSGVVDAGLNAAIRDATDEIEALPDVFKVVGPAGIFAEVAPALAGDEPLADFAADDAAVTDAYIFALSGGNTEIGSYVHDGLDAYRMVVFFPYVENSRLKELGREISSILDTRFRNMPHVSTELSGVPVLWANMDDAISRGQITSILFMAATCFISFFVSLRDWRLAASSTLVNVLPVGMVGALMGATGQPIDMATVFIMSIALGIADDDTSFFVHECLERSRQKETALTDTLRQNGPKMMAACIVVLIGFSMLLTSSFTPMRTFGGLTALGLFLAMLCDVFLLPFLLVAFPGKVNVTCPEQASEHQRSHLSELRSSHLSAENE